METLDKLRAVIAVADITPPRGRGKSYTIHTADGNEFTLWPDKIGLIRTGEQYEVEYSEKEVDGRTYYNITGTPRHLGPYRVAPAKPQPTTNGKNMENNYYKPRDPAEQKQIWVCALLAREIEIMGRPLMNADQLAERAQAHARVWVHLFGSDAEWRRTAEQIARE